MARPKSKSTRTKKEPLDKVTKFYIQNHCKSLSVEQLCEDTAIADKSAVEAYYNECLDKIEKQNTIDKFMNVNTKQGYAVMTQEASEKGESGKKTKTTPKSNAHIHKIRADR